MKITYSRKLDELGRIVLPNNLCAAMNLSPADELQISCEDDKIILTKSCPTCKLCGSSEKINSKLFVCESCIDAIKGL